MFVYALAVDNSGCQIEFNDSDNDGVADSYDECDQTPQNSEVYWNGCLLGDQLEDSDNDGVINDHDLCEDGRNNWQSDTSTMITMVMGAKMILKIGMMIMMESMTN